MAEFTVRPIEDDSVTAFLDDVKDASAFTFPKVLGSLTSKLSYWGCWKGSELVAIWPLCELADGTVFTPDFTYYVGPVFSRHFHQSPAHRKSNHLYLIFSSYMDAFATRYKKISFSLSLSIQDVRYFLWSNHSHSSPFKFEITPRYTAIIHDLPSKTEDLILQSFRETRRNNYRKALTDHQFILDDTPVTAEESRAVIDLYQHTITKQGHAVEPKTLAQIVNFIETIPDSFKYCIKVKSQLTGKLAFFALNLVDHYSSHLVLNLVDEEFRNSKVATLGIMHSILASKKRNCQVFDFNGANSPTRADDKHSYGAEPQLYFSINGVQ